MPMNELNNDAVFWGVMIFTAVSIAMFIFFKFFYHFKK